MHHVSLFAFAASLFLVSGCQSVLNTGSSKQEILGRHLGSARDNQNAARTEFKETMALIKELAAATQGREALRTKLRTRYHGCMRVWKGFRDDVIASEIASEALWDDWARSLGMTYTLGDKASGTEHMQTVRNDYDALYRQLKESETAMNAATAAVRELVVDLKVTPAAEEAQNLHQRIAEADHAVTTMAIEINDTVDTIESFLDTLLR